MTEDSLYPLRGKSIGLRFSPEPMEGNLLDSDPAYREIFTASLDENLGYYGLSLSKADTPGEPEITFILQWITTQGQSRSGTSLAFGILEVISLFAGEPSAAATEDFVIKSKGKLLIGNNEMEVVVKTSGSPGNMSKSLKSLAEASSSRINEKLLEFYCNS
jgi:hypothetical protein